MKKIRVNLFSKKFVQYKYLIMLVVAMIVPSLLVGSLMYYTIFTLTAEQLGIPESIAINLIPVLNEVNIRVVIGLIPLCLFIFVWGLLLTHRFYGPLDRIERNLDELLKGNYNVNFTVRKHDDIRLIVDKLNKLVEMLKKK